VVKVFKVLLQPSKIKLDEHDIFVTGEHVKFNKVYVYVILIYRFMFAF